MFPFYVSLSLLRVKKWSPNWYLDFIMFDDFALFHMSDWIICNSLKHLFRQYTFSLVANQLFSHSKIIMNNISRAESPLPCIRAFTSRAQPHSDFEGYKTTWNPHLLRGHSWKRESFWTFLLCPGGQIINNQPETLFQSFSLTNSRQVKKCGDKLPVGYICYESQVTFLSFHKTIHHVITELFIYSDKN